VKRFYRFVHAQDVEELERKIAEEQTLQEKEGCTLQSVQFQADYVFYACLEFTYEVEWGKKYP
jgi:hypothetical protein